MTHQRRFALVSNLDKTYQQLAKNVPADTEQIFDDDLPKRIYSIENNKQLLEIEKNILIKPKQTSECCLKTLETITKKGTNNTKAAILTVIAGMLASDKRENSQQSTAKGSYQ